MVGAYGPVKAVFVNEAGTPVSGVAILAPGTLLFAHYPRVVYSPDVNGTGGFLVTWHQNDGAGGVNVIHARTVAFAQTPVVGADNVAGVSATGSFWEAAASVAYSRTSKNFLITWQTCCGGGSAVHGVRTDLTGAPIGGSFAISGAGGARDPSVAWNPANDEYGLVYTGFDNTSAFVGFARLRASDGVLLRRNTNVYRSSGTYITDIAYNSSLNTYLIAFVGAGVFTGEVDAAGDLIGGPTPTGIGTYDGLALALNAVSGSVLVAGHYTFEIGGREVDVHGAPISAVRELTASGNKGAFYPRVTANTTRKDWNVSFSAQFASLFNQVVTTTTSLGAQQTPPQALHIDLDGDSNGDAILYNATTGRYAAQTSTANGGFGGGGGTWSPGWTVTPARFNGDAATDFFLFNPQNGQWFKMASDGQGNFTTQATAAWGTNWQRFVVDLNGDGTSDVFLWDAAAGAWFQCLSTPNGDFSYVQGFWSPGWEVYPTKFNSDAQQDFFLINRTTGQWFWALGGANASFTYPANGVWSPDWQLYPADFDGNGLTDLFLYRPATGFWFVASASGSAFTYTSGFFTPGYGINLADLDANGRVDLFLYNATSGVWFEVVSNGSGGFSVGGSGVWSPGWTVLPTDFNNDGRADLLLYNPTNGVWFQARNTTLGAFTYTSGIWDPGLTVTATRLVQ